MRERSAVGIEPGRLHFPGRARWHDRSGQGRLCAHEERARSRNPKLATEAARIRSADTSVELADLNRYPDFAQVKVLDVIVEPGEAMFLPLGWWHQVTALDLSLSFSFSNPAVPNSFSYRNPDIRNW